VDDLQLGERNRQALPLPTHNDEHLALTFLFWSHPQYIDLVCVL
jgi:hypothetical protein